MYMNINSVDKLMGSAIETYRFQVKGNLKALHNLNIHETAAYEMLLNRKSRPKLQYNITAGGVKCLKKSIFPCGLKGINNFKA